jgi:hypothetical protein
MKQTGPVATSANSTRNRVRFAELGGTGGPHAADRKATKSPKCDKSTIFGDEAPIGIGKTCRTLALEMGYAAGCP